MQVSVLRRCADVFGVGLGIERHDTIDMIDARRKKALARFCFSHSAMGVRAAASAVPRVGTARARPRPRRGDARTASRPAPAVVSARSEDSGDPEPDAGDVGVGDDDAALVVDPCKKTRASSSRSGATSISETTTTALALVPPKTALDPLMCRLNARSRTLAYPALFGMTLELRQAWSEEEVGTGAAVWDAAAALADDLARDGAAVALSRWEGMRARGAEDRDAARHTARTVNVTRGDARRWWRNKVVVELGAGLGAASLAAAALGARALATDGDEAVVTLCVENAVANEQAVVSTATRLASFLDNDDGARSEKNTEDTFSPQTPKCARLLWGDDGDARLALEWVRAVHTETNPHRETKSDSYPDAILLADVVYGENASVWRSLVKTLKTLSGPNTVIVLSHARRGRGEGFRQFEEIARDAGFEVEAAETKSDAKDGLLAVTVTYVMRRF